MLCIHTCDFNPYVFIQAKSLADDYSNAEDYIVSILDWPAQPDDPSGIKVASVIGLCVVCSLFSVCYIFF